MALRASSALRGVNFLIGEAGMTVPRAEIFGIFLLI